MVIRPNLKETQTNVCDIMGSTLCPDMFHNTGLFFYPHNCNCIFYRHSNISPSEDADVIVAN